jgi:hypothetical protein
VKRLIQFSLGALWGLQAFGISRVGTARIGDEKLGFEASVPKDLTYQRKVDGGVQLAGLIFAPAGSALLNGAVPVERSVVQVLNFATEFEEFAKLTRAELGEVLGARGFAKQSSSNTCIDRYTKLIGTAETRFAVWGQGRGLALALRPARPTLKQAVDNMLDSIVLTEGSCQW